MNKYHKIQTVYLRDPDTKFKTLLEGQFALPEFEYLANNRWVFTEKVDGTNIRVHWDGEKVSFGGRTDNAQIPTFLVQRLMELFLPDKFGLLAPMTLYGEGYGAKIQKGGGKYIADGIDFILFDVMVGDVYLEREDVEDIARRLDVGVVPIIDTGSLLLGIDIVRRGLRSVLKDDFAEGLVMRPEVELQSRLGRRVVTKIKHKDFDRA